MNIPNLMALLEAQPAVDLAAVCGAAPAPSDTQPPIDAAFALLISQLVGDAAAAPAGVPAADADADEQASAATEEGGEDADTGLPADVPFLTLPLTVVLPPVVPADGEAGGEAPDAAAPAGDAVDDAVAEAVDDAAAEAVVDAAVDAVADAPAPVQTITGSAPGVVDAPAAGSEAVAETVAETAAETVAETVRPERPQPVQPGRAAASGDVAREGVAIATAASPAPAGAPVDSAALPEAAAQVDGQPVLREVPAGGPQPPAAGHEDSIAASVRESGAAAAEALEPADDPRAERAPEVPAGIEEAEVTLSPRAQRILERAGLLQQSTKQESPDVPDAAGVPARPAGAAAGRMMESAASGGGDAPGDGAFSDSQPEHRAAAFQRATTKAAAQAAPFREMPPSSAAEYHFARGAAPSAADLASAWISPPASGEQRPSAGARLAFAAPAAWPAGFEVARQAVAAPSQSVWQALAPRMTEDLAGADVPGQLVRAVRLQWQNGVSEARLQLHPEHLGEVTIALRVERGVVNASIHSEVASVRAWIETHSQQLRDALADQGLKLEDLVVGDEPERHERQQQQQPRRRQRRENPEQRFEVVA